MQFWLRTHTVTPSSYSIVYKEIADALRNAGCDVYLGSNLPEWIDDTIEVWWGNPAYFDWCDKNLPKIAIVLSESRSFVSAQKLAIIQNCKKANVLICPSVSAAVAYMESPINVNVKVIPFGVNLKSFYYIDRDFYAVPFQFLHLAAVHQRKGSWLIPEAFIAAFGEDQRVALTIATGGVLHGSDMYSRLVSEYGKHPQIDFIQERVESSLELYHEHHILVHPHLAEGFGLCILEAMATGMPSLVSRCSAPLEFFDSDSGWWVEMSDSYSPVSETLQSTQGLWRIPDIDSLAEKMKDSRESAAVYNNKAIHARQRACMYPWSNFAKGLITEAKGLI